MHIRSVQAFLLFAALLGGLGSCNSPVSPVNPDSHPPLDVPWTESQSIVCFGTSLTYGFMWESLFVPAGPTEFSRPPAIPPFAPAADYASEDMTSYPALLARRLRIKVYKQGYIGWTAERALGVVGDSVLSKNPALILLEFGANELLRGTDVQDAEVDLLTLVDTLIQAGSRVVLLSFLYPEMIASIPPDHFLAGRKDDGEAYLAMLRRVARSRGLMFVEYAMRGIYWNDDFMSDSVHPNREGYRRMEENIFRALELTFRRNFMLNETLS